jgi:hypothetical protein
MLATLTTAEAHRYLIAFMIVVAVIGLSLLAILLAAVAAYRSTTRASKRYPRLQCECPEPVEPCDLRAHNRAHHTLRRRRERTELRRLA